MNIPGIDVSVVFPAATPRRRTPEDVLEALQRTGRDDRGKHRSMVAAARFYDPMEFVLIQKMKGGTPHERAVAEVKKMFQEDAETVLQNFIGSKNTERLRLQIQAALHDVQRTYDEVFRQLGMERIVLDVKVAPDSNVIELVGRQV
jgi:trans-2-enoyl-CoA reductase